MFHTILRYGCGLALALFAINFLTSGDTVENESARAWLRDKARRERKEMRKP